MSLKAFHLLFIVISVVLSAFFGSWCLNNYSDTQSALILSFGIGSLTSTVGLCLYLAWFLKKTKNVGYLSWVAASTAILYSTSASACTVCIGNPNAIMAKSANTGVMFLLAVIMATLVAFAGLFLFWILRARRLAH